MNIDPLSFLFKDKKDLVMVEIGVYKANSTIYMLDNFDIKKYYAIDPFVQYDQYYEGRVYDWFNELGNDVCFEYVRDLLSKYDNVELIRDFSVNAIKYVKDDTLDFCWIDGNHSYKHIIQDIKCWFFKVKEGGIISGDDIFLPEVNKAVDEVFSGKYDVFKGKRSWFVVV